MLAVFRNRYHPRVDVTEPAIRQPGHEAWAVALRLVFYVVMLAVIGFVAWSAFDLGRQEAGFDSGEARDLRRALKERLEETVDERDQLHRRIVVLERTIQVDRESTRQAREALLEIQDERLKLKEEIAFLSSLMSDGETKVALRLRHVTMTPLDEPGLIRYRATVSKFPQNNEEVRAGLSIAVHGKQNGSRRELVYAERGASDDQPGDLVFKHLIQVEGTLKLPAGFEPQHLVLSVEPKAGAAMGAAREFPWDPET